MYKNQVTWLSLLVMLHYRRFIGYCDNALYLLLCHPLGFPEPICLFLTSSYQLLSLPRPSVQPCCGEAKLRL